MFNFELFYSDQVDFPSIPAIETVHCLDFVQFSRCKAATCYDHGVHFFEGDQFYESVWKYPRRYLELLQRFQYVVMPDFSICYNFPRPVAEYNKYRNHVLAFWWASHGVRVIPSVSLYRPDCFEHFAQGLPQRSVLAFSTVGAVREPEERENVLRQLDYVFMKLDPLEVLLFCSGDLETPYDDRLTRIRIGGVHGGQG